MGKKSESNIDYIPVSGWIDLTRLKPKLPKKKFAAYAELQAIVQEYQRKPGYYGKYYPYQVGQAQEAFATMQLDLIRNYGALEGMQYGENDISS